MPEPKPIRQYYDVTDVSKAFLEFDVAVRYSSARRLPEVSINLWIEILQKEIQFKQISLILDIGSGTGRFSKPLARHFSCPVIALDPSIAMLAETDITSNNIIFIQGYAEQLPIQDNGIGLVWMSQVFHHLNNPERSLDEIHRVLTRGGIFAVRNGTRESEGEVLWTRFFPEVLNDNINRLPTRQFIVSSASKAGFIRVTVQKVKQLSASSPQEYYKRISKRGVSSLIAISDEAFNAGLERLKRWVDLQPQDMPIYDPAYLFVFRCSNRKAN